MSKDQLIHEITVTLCNDPQKQYPLCIQLLELSEQEQDVDGIVLACAHLVYCCGILNNLEERNIYFIKADQLCQKKGLTQLHVKLYNLMGLSLTDMSDNYLALEYFDLALKLCHSLDIPLEESKIYNNMCVAFANCRDEETALKYANKACEVFLPCLNEDNKRYYSVYLINVAMLNTSLNYFDHAKKALDECEILLKDDPDNSLYCACQRATLYCKSREIYLCLQTEKNIIRPQILIRETGNSFLYDIAGSLLELMIELNEPERSKIYLDFIEKNLNGLSLSSLYYLIKKIIKYYEKYGEKSSLNKYYEQFYDIMSDISHRDNAAFAQNICAKVQFATTKMDQEKILYENEQLKYDGITDKLTGLHNLRHFHKLTSKLMVEKTTKTLGYIMIDVDYFKDYNDQYGHYIGDEVLKAVATVLKENAPIELYLCRCGGDEFACLCVNMESSAIERYLQNIQDSLQKKEIKHEKSKVSDYVTLSIGFCNTHSFSNIKKLYKAADAALYQTKRAGRNGYSYVEV